ncbi:uncharacterized protein LOC143034930 [Oratosquilla oratoria]|uniref:uncharacterized protein LOC143034930 n=1 Tax=Oratosquilla oratoria TaxID=337810 RepID=UPI003F76D18C
MTPLLHYESHWGHQERWRRRRRIVWWWLGAATALALWSGDFSQVRGSIIPPQWANVTLNPCAQNSWQKLYWPPDQKCYKIFSQGPCEKTQEFYFDNRRAAGACRCPRGSLRAPGEVTCHQEYTRGHCNPREYVTRESFKDNGDLEGEVICRPFRECPPGHVFWPPTETCYEYHSQGPCLYGQLLHVDPITGSPACGCLPSLMATQFWSPTQTCHELYTRGPCALGHVFLYNASMRSTHCTCNPHLLTNFHRPTGQCYELGSSGPCRPGQVFTFVTKAMAAMCRCMEGYVEWASTGYCYRLYTKGPCEHHHFITYAEDDPSGTLGQCIRNPCVAGRLYHPPTDSCHQVGVQGPCELGHLFVYERATSLRGICSCTPDLVGYWKGNGRCYELGVRGPCLEGEILAYSKGRYGVRCVCDVQRGYLADPQRGTCVRGGLLAPCRFGHGSSCVCPPGSLTTNAATEPACVTPKLITAVNVTRTVTASVSRTSTATAARPGSPSVSAPRRSNRHPERPSLPRPKTAIGLTQLKPYTTHQATTEGGADGAWRDSGGNGRHGVWRGDNRGVWRDINGVIQNDSGVSHGDNGARHGGNGATGGDSSGAQSSIDLVNIVVTNDRDGTRHGGGDNNNGDNITNRDSTTRRSDTTVRREYSGARGRIGARIEESHAMEIIANLAKEFGARLAQST